MIQSLKKKTGRVMRSLRYLKRMQAGSMAPIHISGDKVKERRDYYDTVVQKFVQEMKACRETDTFEFPQNEIFSGYDILSFNGDRMGKVFAKDGEIYRGIYRESCDDFKQMWKTGLLQVLSRHGFIPETVISGYYTDEYPIILRHGTVDMNASKLWSYNMLVAASIRISLINTIARQVGFTLHDGHMNNVTFYLGEPVFTDIGSFVKDRGQITVCNKEIVFTGCYRCVFQLLGNFMLSRSQPYDEANNMIWITPRYYDDLTEEYRLALSKFRSYHSFRSSPAVNRIIHRIFDCWDVRPEYLEALFRLRTDIGTNAYEEDVRRITEAVEEAGIDARSAVDVGGTKGRMSEQLYKKYKMKVTDCETDDFSCDMSVAFFDREKIPGNVYAFHYLYGCDPDSRKSVRAELVTCADITHNVFSVQQYRIDSLINSLRKMTDKYVVVTYYPFRTVPERYIPRVDEQGEEDIAYFTDTFSLFFEPLLKKEFGDSTGTAAEKENYCLLLAGRVR